MAKIQHPQTEEIVTDFFYKRSELIDLLIETTKQHLWDEGVYEQNLDKAAIINLRGAIDAINEKYINQI